VCGDYKNRDLCGLFYFRPHERARTSNFCGGVESSNSYFLLEHFDTPATAQEAERILIEMAPLVI